MNDTTVTETQHGNNSKLTVQIDHKGPKQGQQLQLFDNEQRTHLINVKKKTTTQQQIINEKKNNKI